MTPDRIAHLLDLIAVYGGTCADSVTASPADQALYKERRDVLMQQIRDLLGAGPMESVLQSIERRLRRLEKRMEDDGK